MIKPGSEACSPPDLTTLKHVRIIENVMKPPCSDFSPASFTTPCKPSTRPQEGGTTPFKAATRPEEGGTTPQHKTPTVIVTDESCMTPTNCLTPTNSSTLKPSEGVEPVRVVVEDSVTTTTSASESQGTPTNSDNLARSEEKSTQQSGMQRKG